MASSSSNYNPNNPQVVPSSSVGFDPSNPATVNTTFVQADPSNFRAVVQRLTGATHDPKLPVTTRPPGKPISGEMGPRRPPFKLQERRQGAKKLEIKLNNGVGPLGSPSVRQQQQQQRGFIGFGAGAEMMMISPVSPLDLFGRGSPRSPTSPVEEEERAIAEKGFYLHPSPLSTPRGSDPELLPLFPLTSPRGDNN